jgi:hypothetical protein
MVNLDELDKEQQIENDKDVGVNKEAKKKDTSKMSVVED